MTEIDRRRFLGTAGTLAALTATAGVLPGAFGSPAAAVEVAPSGPVVRKLRALQVRVQAAQAEAERPLVPQPTNGDEERYANRIGNFSKGLPHNDLGEVDAAAYAALLAALRAGTTAAFDAVPLGTPNGLKLVNPIGGLAFDLTGPDVRAVPYRTPPAFATAETAAEMADCYWMALCRDVPFADYATSSLIAAACADLSAFTNYPGPRIGGAVTPQSIFRIGYPGALDGPFVSQFMLQPYRFNGSAVDQKVRVQSPGQGFLTRYADWLSRLRGGPAVGTTAFDPVARHYRAIRDIGQSTLQDAIYSPYFAAALILNGLGASVVDDGNPYKASAKMSGNVTFGLPHLLGLLGQVGQFERHAFHQKWQVHRRIRPDYYAGRVHNHVLGRASYPLHPQLLNSGVLPRMAAYNQALAGEATYLLPSMQPEGSPAHPGWVSGHATTAGACVTLLKAWFFEDQPFPNPVRPNPDGTALVPYVAGVDGPALTVGGELNKLASSIALGRGIGGVHFRSDSTDGILIGEELAVRTLAEQRACYPESAVGFTLRKFDGSTVTV